MPLLSIYNNLIHGYLMSRQTRFDSHKRSELSDIHSRIRKLSAEQPLYKIDFNDDVQEYTLTVKERAMEVTAAMKELGSGDVDGSFSRFTIKSDTPGAVGVELLDGSDPRKIDDVEVDVDSISSPQITSGNTVDSKENSLVAGQYNFTVEIEGNFYSFQFNVTGKNNNLELQMKLADFINKTKVGLRAEVVNYRDKGVSALNLQAKKDGVPFTFRDTKTPEGTNSGIVDFFGLNNIRNEAGKTVAYIDGVKYESADRKIVTSGGLLLDIKRETGNRPARIMKVADDESVYRKVSEFINKFNDLSDYVRAGAETRRASKKLQRDLVALLRRNAVDLTQNGIEISEDGLGHLQLNREMMSMAVKNGTLENLFKPDSDIARDFMRKLSDIYVNPMDLVDKLIVVYPNPGNNLNYNPYITSIYSGMMYNNYC